MAAALTVRDVKLLRHPPLLFWAITLCALIVLLAAAQVQGADAAQPQPLDPSADATSVFALRQRMTELYSLIGTTDGAIGEWAEDTAVLADRAADYRRLSVGDDDEMVIAYEVVVADASLLAATDPADVDTVTHLTRRIAAGLDRLSGLVHLAPTGIPTEVMDPELDEMPITRPRPPDRDTADDLPDADVPDATVPTVTVAPIDPADSPSATSTTVAPRPAPTLPGATSPSATAEPAGTRTGPGTATPAAQTAPASPSYGLLTGPASDS